MVEISSYKYIRNSFNDEPVSRFMCFSMFVGVTTRLAPQYLLGLRYGWRYGRQMVSSMRFGWPLVSLVKFSHNIVLVLR